MTSNCRQRYGGVEMSDYFGAVLSSQQYKADVRHGNSTRTQQGEKRGEKRGWVEEKKERKNQCCCFSPTRGDPERALAGGAGDSWEAKAILGFFLHFTAFPLGTSLDEQRQSLAFSTVHQQISDKTDFQGKILIYWHWDVLTFNALVSQWLICWFPPESGLPPPMALGSPTWHIRPSAQGTAMQGYLTQDQGPQGFGPLCFPVREKEIEETLQVPQSALMIF